MAKKKAVVKKAAKVKKKAAPRVTKKIAKKISKKAAKGKPAVRKRRAGRAGLDYAAALRKYSKGATLRNIARAAGSRAAERNKKRIGLKILKRLRDQGEIIETFDRIGYTIETFAAGVALQAASAEKVTRDHYFETVNQAVGTSSSDWNQGADSSTSD